MDAERGRPTFGDKFRHMIIGKRVVEDREVKIGDFTFTGVHIEVPEGHEGFGWPNSSAL
jgi:hypothetical protein